MPKDTLQFFTEAWTSHEITGEKKKEALVGGLLWKHNINIPPPPLKLLKGTLVTFLFYVLKSLFCVSVNQTTNSFLHKRT